MDGNGRGHWAWTARCVLGSAYPFPPRGGRGPCQLQCNPRPVHVCVPLICWPRGSRGEVANSRPRGCCSVHLAPDRNIIHPDLDAQRRSPAQLLCSRLPWHFRGDRKECRRPDSPRLRSRDWLVAMTAKGPGCAKTRGFSLLVESSSQFGQSENQKCWRRLSKEGNRENGSTLSWLAHVFTRPGSRAVGWEVLWQPPRSNDSGSLECDLIRIRAFVVGGISISQRFCYRIRIAE